MEKLKKDDIVFIKSTNAIAVIINVIDDNFGVSYRTDADGVREKDELIKINNRAELMAFMNKKGIFIANTLKIKLNV